MEANKGRRPFRWSICGWAIGRETPCGSAKISVESVRLHGGGREPGLLPQYELRGSDVITSQLRSSIFLWRYLISLPAPRPALTYGVKSYRAACAASGRRARRPYGGGGGEGGRTSRTSLRLWFDNQRDAVGGRWVVSPPATIWGRWVLFGCVTP